MDKGRFPIWYFACVLSCFGCVWHFETLWAVAHQATLSMGFSRQEYWSGLSCPPPGDLPHPGIEPGSLMSPALAGGFFTTTTKQIFDQEILDWNVTGSDSWGQCPFYWDHLWKNQIWSLRFRILIRCETRWYKHEQEERHHTVPCGIVTIQEYLSVTLFLIKRWLLIKIQGKNDRNPFLC